MLNEGSNCLWQTHGSKIISLKLDSCKFGATILGHIIFSCPNMTEFCVNDGYYNMGSFGFPGMFLCTKFKHPQEGTFKREKLEKLTFDADEMPVIYPDLERFYTYFPNVKSLNINLCTEEPLEKNKDLTHFQALLTLISQETSKIDTLFINFHDDETYLFKDLPVMKLKCMADYDLSKWVIFFYLIYLQDRHHLSNGQNKYFILFDILKIFYFFFGSFKDGSQLGLSGDHFRLLT